MPSKDMTEAYVRLGGDRARLVALYESAHYETERIRARHRQQRREYTVAIKEVETVVPPSAAKSIIEAADASYFIGTGGFVEEARFVLSVRTKEEDIDDMRTIHSYNADRRRGVVTIDAGIGCFIKNVDEAPNGTIDATLGFNKTLHYGDIDAYVLSYRIRINSKKPIDPMVVYDSATHTVVHTARVRFADPTKVKSVWWIAAESGTTALMTPRPDHFFEFDPTGYYVREFRELVPNWLYGIAWDVDFE